MKLYLAQHGEAESKETNPERPLTTKGRQDVESSAKLIDPGSISKIYHSGKLRAKETAEILARGRETTERELLTPMDPIDSIVEEIEKNSEDLMIVGHLPFMAKLASFLLAGNQEKETIQFEQGVVFCLEKKDKWKLLPLPEIRD